MPKYILNKKSGTFYLISAPKNILLQHILSWLTNNELFSISQEDPQDRESMISAITKLTQLQLEDLGRYPGIVQMIPYKCVMIDTENPGLDECGLLSEFSTIFAKNNIPILSNSTFYRNYIFYPSQYDTKFNDLINKEEDYKLESSAESSN
tara:strand:+ start:488 stop:940 length:453 start_codon:yes stop_codon:yes gene_type:complete